MKLPNIWGQGALFAFSGLDGECRVHSCLNASLLGDLLGIRIQAKEIFDLYILLDGIKDIHYDLVASDVIRARLKDAQGQESPVIITFMDQCTVVGLCGRGRVQLRSLRALSENRTASGSEFVSGASAFRFWREDRDSLTLFSFSTKGFIPVAKEKIQALADAREAFLGRFEPILPRDEDAALTFLKCVSVMKSQVYTADGQFCQRWTTPNRLPHRWLWLWDSVFHGLGNFLLDETLPRDSLLSVLDVQKEDGFVPHLARPSFTSDITQPPVLAWGAVKLYRRTGEKDFLRLAAPKLDKYLTWNINNRLNTDSGLFCWHVNTDSDNCRADESGMDNSPRFDGVKQMECIDFCCFMANEAQAMAEIYDALGDAKGVWWRAYFEELRQRINTCLWDEKDQLYYDRVPGSGFHRVKSVASFLPLFAGVCTENTAAALIGHLKDESTFHTRLPIPSVAMDDPTYGTDMWRGPVWINYNYMICEGLRRYGFGSLADEIVLKTVREIARFFLTDGVVYEMYDPDGLMSPRSIRRKGPVIEPYDPRVRYQVIRDYGWTSSLCAAMIAENPHLFGGSKTQAK
ncbi:MAG: hypothetical protein II912_00725 [Clostridia bacterium]|nr:hypothetical protein [Clostridia bacterium]